VIDFASWLEQLIRLNSAIDGNYAVKMDTEGYEIPVLLRLLEKDILCQLD